MDIVTILRKNSARLKEASKKYDPVTGEGCLGNRVRLVIEDAPCSLSETTDKLTLWLPEEMMHTEICKQLQKYGSVSKIFKENGEEIDAESYFEFWIGFCELRIQYDFEYFAAVYETIEDGQTQSNVPFYLKRGQRELLKTLEDMRHRGVPIRVIIVKARQLGLSTLTQLYMLWIQIIHKRNWHSVICAHVKDAASNIRGMFDRVIEHMPPLKGKRYSIAPFKSTQNIKIIPQNGCRITIGSAEKPESVRGQNPMLAHFSEIGMYPNTEKKSTGDLIGSIIGAMKRVPYSMIVYESTAKGMGDFFHTEWEKAVEGKTPFEPVFLPWYFDNTYSESFDGTYYNHSGKKTNGTIDDFIMSLDSYELELFMNHNECTLENINWYRGKCAEMSSDELMKQEYPSTASEAFQNSGLPIFRLSHIETLKDSCKLPISVGCISGDCDPALAYIDSDKKSEVLSGLKYIEDRDATACASGSDPKLKDRLLRNKLKVWEFPVQGNCSDRYVVIYDPQKGLSEKADWGVITVFDRYWMMYKGKPEVVAEWRGRMDKDITIWIAAQIAKYYNNALLVIESNTFETDASKYDSSEFIFNIVANYYSNLYSRPTPPDEINKGKPPRMYGWHTNRKSKQTIVSHYAIMLREKGYIERNIEALIEASYYEQKENGAFGAKTGKHDDILMTRMIGCFMCYDLPMPQEIDEYDASEDSGERIIGVSSF